MSSLTLIPSLVILSWFVDSKVLNAAINGNIIGECQVETQLEKVPSSCLDENVCIETCQKYFSHDARAVVCNVVDTVRKNPIYYCGRCTCPIADDKHQSIACDCCLTWFHFTCLSMTMPSKAKVWICRGCCAM